MTVEPGRHNDNWSHWHSLPDRGKAPWTQAFGDHAQAWADHFRNLDLARRYHRLGLDPDTARDWADTMLHADAITYLVRRGLRPAKERFRGLIDHACAHVPYTTGNDFRRATHTVAALLHAHPTLATSDAVLLATANITLDEADHLITTGTLDRDALHLLTALR